MTDETMRAIQDRARDEAASQMPPELGAFIAWAETDQMAGRTVGFSELHRVGEPIRGEPYTTCREKIKPPVMWLALSPAIIRTMKRCGFCEAGVARKAQEAA